MDSRTFTPKRTPILVYDDNGPTYGIIPLTLGLVAVVDPYDFSELSRYSWYAKPAKRTYYAVRGTRIKGKNKKFVMHRVIMNASAEQQVDHEDLDGLNNRRANLRICSNAENHHNSRLQRNNTSGAKGVSWFKDTNSWRVRLKVNNKEVHLGLYRDKTAAIEAYNRSAIQFYGEFARLNPMPQDALCGGK